MATRFKTFLLGFVIGSLIAFFIGINYGRDVPLLSNPFAYETVKEKAGALVEGAKEKIHDATKPDPKSQGR